MNIKKPNSFARYGNNYVAPLTTIDQIVKPSGERYTDKDFELMSNVENVMFGDAAGKNLLTQKVVYSSFATYINGIMTNTDIDTISSLGLFIRIHKEPNVQSSFIEISDTFTKQSGYDYLYIKHNGASKDIGVMFDISNLIDGETYTFSFKLVSTSPSVVGGLVISNFMIEQGSTATEYEPYIKSLKGLTDSALNMDLLWTNASPSSAFASQTVSLDLSKYNFVLIHIGFNNNSNGKKTISTHLLSISDDLLLMANSSAVISYREAKITSNGIEFGIGYYVENYNNSHPMETSDNAIPYRIYGVR